MAFIVENQIADTNTPHTVNCTVRKYFIEREVETLMDCARKRRRAHDHHRVSSPHQTAWEGCWTAVQGPSAHAATRLRLQACKRWPRHARPAALSGPQEHPTHGSLHRAKP